MRSSLEDRLWAVVLAGGIGSRFWPASTPHRPKQLLPLASNKPLIRETVERIAPLIPLERVRILTGPSLAEPIREAIPGLASRNFFLEPRAAGTAPILAWAAAEIAQSDPEAIMVSLHADHLIDPARNFRSQILEAASVAAEHKRLVTLGATPDRPETGYGYIRRGAPLPDRPGITAGTAFQVESFVEKPDVHTAIRYLAEGGYLWNTGIFIWRVRDLLHELERYTPEIATLMPLLHDQDVDAYFERVPSLSIDEGLLERSDRVAVLPASFGWDDIGSWEALFRTHSRDPAGNVMIGDAIAIDSRDSALYAEDGPIIAFGVEDLVIVRSSGVTFVAPRARSGELKALLEGLPERLRLLDPTEREIP